ncbi:MAG: NapC/NirT family cytochrome c [Kofleriaceae bacterium]|jgi:nitrate/TMAO reductase-like tetraheme cytochrome c subunit|nr:NapC/NirT family cytochrome c [Kofleriaceae bacterium]MBP9858357.1 NapC/NirT family cytochrome c [Kofleriaceae bacterium]
MHLDVFGWVALAGAAIAAAILVWYLIARPPLNRATKLALLLGIGAFPLATAGSGNYAGFEATKRREFCGSCHVMTPYQRDVEDPASTSLAAIHSRNQTFGRESCYTCHADYGMFGTIVTKGSGLRHVYHYLLTYRSMSLAEARKSIRLRGTFPSSTCRRCHTTTAPGWKAVPDHAALADDLAQGKVGCVGEGCHGPAHPWSKDPK